jgi:hypothetical protein
VFMSLVFCPSCGNLLLGRASFKLVAVNKRNARYLRRHYAFLLRSMTP